MRDSFLNKILYIIFVNFIWFMTLVISTLCLESVYSTRVIASILLKPICMFVVIPLILHGIMFVLCKKQQKSNKTDRIILISFDAILCALMYVVLIFY